jgi:hypothetical protein
MASVRAREGIASRRAPLFEAVTIGADAIWMLGRAVGHFAWINADIEQS